MELPPNLAGIAVMEDIGSFKENRYFLSEREHSVAELIVRMNDVSIQLMERGVQYLSPRFTFWYVWHFPMTLLQFAHKAYYRKKFMKMVFEKLEKLNGIKIPELDVTDEEYPSSLPMLDGTMTVGILLSTVCLNAGASVLILKELWFGFV